MPRRLHRLRMPGLYLIHRSLFKPLGLCQQRRAGRLPSLGFFRFEGFGVGLGLAKAVMNAVWGPCEGRLFVDCKLFIVRHE